MASGAIAVRIVYSSRHGSRSIEHLGLAHEGELEAFKAAPRQRLAARQGELSLGLAAGASADGPLGSPRRRWGTCAVPMTGSAFGRAAGGDEVFPHLVLAWIIEPADKQDSLRVLQEASVDAASYPTLRTLGATGWPLPAPAHAALGPVSLVLYYVPALYLETGQGDGFRSGVLQGTPPGPADHHRAAHLTRPDPADGRRRRRAEALKSGCPAAR